MVGWHPQLDRYEFEQTLGVGDGQGGVACCSPWGYKESDVTELTCLVHLLILSSFFIPVTKLLQGHTLKWHMLLWFWLLIGMEGISFPGELWNTLFPWF